VPKHKSIAVGVVWSNGSSQRKLKGAVPFIIDTTETVPSHAPQEVSPVDAVFKVIGAVTSTKTGSVKLQLLGVAGKTTVAGLFGKLLVTQT